MPGILKFSSFEEMKSYELQQANMPFDETKIDLNLSAFIAISNLNPNNKRHSNSDTNSNEFGQATN